jgi:hypothetical protein
MTSRDFRKTSVHMPDFDLIAFLFRGGHDRSVSSKWVDDTRTQFSNALARVLVNEQLLDAHVQSLKAKQRDAGALGDSFPEDKIRIVVAGGLKVLDNSSMIALALDPSALGLIHHAIYEEMSLTWSKVIVDEGRLELQGHGLSVPALKDLLGAAKANGF